MWKIKQIFDGDFGCEELAPGEKPKGKEWQADYLPGAFKEAEELIQKARERKRKM